MYHGSNRSIAILSIASLFSYNIFALSDSSLMVERSSLMVPERLGQISVVHDEEGFHVLKDDQVHPIKNHWVGKRVRNIKREHLIAFLDKEMGNGYLSVGQFDGGEYNLEAKVRGPGAGLVTAWFLYTFTKGACIGVGVSALGAGVAVVGTGIPGALAGAGLAAVTGGASTTATVVSGAIAAGGYTAIAVEATTAVGMVGGSIAGAAAIVEAASVAAFAAGMACPFCP